MTRPTPAPDATRAARGGPGGLSPKALDVAAFCRDGGKLDGQVALADLPRLAESVIRPDDGAEALPVSWRAAGALQPVTGGEPQRLVDLDVHAEPLLECQRCLQPVRLPIEVRRRFRFVRGEEAAARLDEELEEDVLALTPRFDLLALVEDELLLALPLVPRHEVCPDLPPELRPGAEVEAPTQVDAEAAAPPEHPFAALAALRRRNPQP